MTWVPHQWLLGCNTLLLQQLRTDKQMYISSKQSFVVYDQKSVPVLIVKCMHTLMSIWAFSPQKITVLVAFNENGLTILVRVCQSGVFMISWSHMCTCIAFFNQAGGNVTVESFVSMASHYLSKCVVSCSTPFKCQPRCFEVA